jgi:hypothetical protein
MGLFTKSKSDTERMLDSHQARGFRGYSDDQTSSGSGQVVKKRKVFKIRKKKSKFRQLVEAESESIIDYIPPEGLDVLCSEFGLTQSSSEDSLPVLPVPQERKPTKKTPKKMFQRLDTDSLKPERIILRQQMLGSNVNATRFQRLDSTTSLDSSSLNEYQPPGDIFLKARQSWRGSEATFDVRSDHTDGFMQQEPSKRTKVACRVPAIKIKMRHAESDIHSERSDYKSTTAFLSGQAEKHRMPPPPPPPPPLYHEANGRRQELVQHPGSKRLMAPEMATNSRPRFGTAESADTDLSSVREGNGEFRQFLFDENFKEIQNVATAKSDHAQSDLSDFVKGSAQLSKVLSPEDKAEKKNPSLSRSIKKPLVKDHASALSQRTHATDLGYFSGFSFSSRPRGTQSVRQQKYPTLTLKSLAASSSQHGSSYKALASALVDDITSNVSEANATFDSQAVSESYIQKLKQSSSMDDVLIASIRRAAQEKLHDPDVDPHKPDPSPRGVKQSSSDSALEHSNGRRTIQKAVGPQKNPPKAVPSNAILGSMLFLQTEVPPATERKLQVAPRQKSRKKYQDDDDGSEHERCSKIPRSVRADDSLRSEVSSITEEASSFCQKNVGGYNQWSKQAYHVLDHYNVKKMMQQSSQVNNNTLVARDMNSYLMSRQEQDHANLFQS